MSKVAVVYTSTTGNTEKMAEAVAEGAKSKGAEVVVLTADAFSAGEVANYDAIAFGSPAMGVEQLEESTFEPIIGSELQSKELIKSLTEDKEGNDIWKSEIFGRSLEVIVQEGIQAKLAMLPDKVRFKLCQTLTKIINKGSNTMIAIVI